MNNINIKFQNKLKSLGYTQEDENIRKFLIVSNKVQSEIIIFDQGKITRLIIAHLDSVSIDYMLIKDGIYPLIDKIIVDSNDLENYLLL